MKQIKEWFFLVAMVIMSTMLIVGCLSSCNPQRKIQKAEQVLKDADALAKICADEFPIKTEYIKGKDSISFDTLYVDGIINDTTILVDTVTKLVTKVVTKSLPAKIITKTIRIVDTIREENPATIKVLKDEIVVYKIRNGVLEADRDNWKVKAKQRLWWFLIAVGAIGAYTILKIKKIISF